MRQKLTSPFLKLPPKESVSLIFVSVYALLPAIEYNISWATESFHGVATTAENNMFYHE